MRQQNQVSAWFGRAESEAALRRALVVHYSEDGDFQGSAFSRGFRLGRYDDSRREALRHERAPNRLGPFLAGVSYEASVVKGLAAFGVSPASEENAFVLLYDYRCKAPVGTRWSTPGLELRFVGTTRYDTNEG
jgi:hypothetical protein